MFRRLIPRTVRWYARRGAPRIWQSDSTPPEWAIILFGFGPALGARAVKRMYKEQSRHAPQGQTEATGSRDERACRREERTGAEGEGVPLFVDRAETRVGRGGEVSAVAVSKVKFPDQDARAQNQKYDCDRGDAVRQGLALSRVLPLPQQV